MKTYVSYTIWNKQDQIDWIMRGINYFIPKGSVVHFILDHCDDDSVERTIIFANKYLKEFDFFYETATETNRWQNTNVALKRFLQSDCGLFLSPQDDQRIQDSKLISNLLRFNPETTGIIGMRDGLVGTDGRVTHSAHHSILPNPDSTTWLSPGEFAEVDCINDGPVAMFKQAVEKVGLFDVENFKAFYTEYDYALRCKSAGLANYVMGVELVHEKLGKQSASNYGFNSEIAEHDLNSLRRKHFN